MSPASLTGVQQGIAIASALVLLILVVRLIYRGRLREDYGAVWLCVSVATLVLAIWQDGLRLIARAVDAVTLTAPVFLLSITFLTALGLHVSVRLSEHDRQLKRLAQTIALMDEALRRSDAEDAGRGEVGGGAAQS